MSAQDSKRSLALKTKFPIQRYSKDLTHTNCVSIQAMLMRQQLRWTSHVCRMEDYQLPKCMLYGELSIGSRCRGGQRKRFEDQLKKTLVHCNLDVDTWETVALDRSAWRSSTKSGVQEFELSRISEAKAKRQRLKEAPPLDLNGSSPCIFVIFVVEFAVISHLSLPTDPDRILLPVAVLSWTKFIPTHLPGFKHQYLFHLFLSQITTQFVCDPQLIHLQRCACYFVWVTCYCYLLHA